MMPPPGKSLSGSDRSKKRTCQRERQPGNHVCARFSRNQTEAIQFSVFFLLPVFVLSGAFAPLEQLPQAIRYVSELFPLTHFCRAFRLVNMYHASARFYIVDLVVLLAGALITFIGAAFLLKRIEQ